MYCLDTNIAVDHLRGDLTVTKRLQQIQKMGVELAITSISLCELYKGAYLSEHVEQNLAGVDVFLGAVTLLSQDKLSCLLFGQDYAELQKKGVPTQETDLMIASISKANNRILVTRNAKDFKNIPNLVINRW